MSGSKLPNGGYTLTSGSNYMLDGFQFDTEYNGGVLEKARLPEAKGLSVLPSGMIPPDSPLNSDLPTGVEVELDLDLEDFTKEASQDVPLIDHSWLASLPKEDLKGMRSYDDVLEHFSEGRFEHPQANQLKTLQDSWGSGSTTGLDIIPNSQRVHQKYQNPYHKEQSQLPGDDYRRLKEEASRKVAYGESPSNLGDLPDSIRNTLNEEYGLHGKVYIKEASFPGLFNGRWDEVINKRCATSLYIIPNHKDCAFDRFLGMQVVASESEIPWKQAYSTLMPKLASYGVSKVSGSDFKGLLKQAFIDLAEGRVAKQETPQTWFQTQSDPTEGLSFYEAQRQLQASEVEQDFFFSQEEVAENKEMDKLKRTASQLVQQHLLESEQADAIISDSSKTASQRLERLYEVSSMPQKSSAYEGYGKEATYHISERPQMETDFKSREEITFEKRANIASAKIGKLVKAGFLTNEEAIKVSQANKSAPEMAILKAFEKAASRSFEETGLYEGVGEEVAYLTRKQASIETKFKTRSEVTFAQRAQKAQNTVARLIKAGLISESDLDGFEKMKGSPEDKLLKVYEKAASKSFEEKKDYGGVGEDVTYLTKKRANIELTLAQRTEMAQTKVAKLLDAGLISESDFEDFNRMKGSPEDKLLKVFEKAASKDSKKVAYAGQVYDQSSRASVNEMKSMQEAFFKKVSSQTQAQYEQQVMRELSRVIKAGLISQEEVDGVISKHASLDARLQEIYRLVNKTETQKATGATAHVLNKKSSERLASEIKVATWLRQKMTEGSAGQELDALLSARFSQAVLAEHQQRIASLRNDHEGVSGHAYVDAEAYMTQGTEGCEKGALLHRANQIPTLLKTAKCGTCVFNTGGSCQKYNKTIVASAEEIVGDKSHYQKEMIRLANASDSEQTASLFVNNYDASEFGLTQDGGVDLSDAPDNETLGDVLFGGFEV